ncbi:hypothetical protein GPECTOR_88g460 [Gonium pectorale]|uniref:Uncharacterized protein n=1 Tax=Gonium pectorale TaxID=33097 RepID=A0A150G101_GONPE|nr:hypothetical protein GPECTOR_88g460 [Gonium pectorale]|eukprot:KXZ43517.1 hypothetical protein GPECTOR_88g460 [Gonium pectorale]
MAAVCASSKVSVARPTATRRVAVARPAARLVVRASAEPAQINKKALVAGLSAASAATLAIPQVAEAVVTPSLRNFLYSLVAGGVVLGAIAIAITAVSKFDNVKRD